MFARWWPLLFWLAVGAMSAGALVMEWRNPPRLPVPTVVEAPAAVTVPPLQSFDPPDLLRYAQIAERPIFIDTRRPEKDEPVALPAAAPPPEPDQPLDLIGVLLIPGAAAALLRPTELKIKDPTKTNAKVLRVAQGEKVDGWELQSVNADKVVLRKNGEIRELLLLRPPTPTRATAPGTAVSPQAALRGIAPLQMAPGPVVPSPRIISPPAAPESVAPPQEMLPPL